MSDKESKLACLQALYPILDKLNLDETSVLLAVAQGLEKGQAQYGKLNIRKDSRDMTQEAFEEIRDSLVYVGVRMVQLQSK